MKELMQLLRLRVMSYDSKIGCGLLIRIFKIKKSIILRSKINLQFKRLDNHNPLSDPPKTLKCMALMSDLAKTPNIRAFFIS